MDRISPKAVWINYFGEVTIRTTRRTEGSSGPEAPPPPLSVSGGHTVRCSQIVWVVRSGRRCGRYAGYSRTLVRPNRSPGFVEKRRDPRSSRFSRMTFEGGAHDAGQVADQSRPSIMRKSRSTPSERTANASW
jgi:hypothetical protein